MAEPVKTPGRVQDLLSLVKPRVTQLVVFTMGAGLYLAPGSVGALRAVLSLLGCVLLVSRRFAGRSRT